jgi:UDP-N-acetyl-2-amino-2-deoxyglucuronate dehydrogenase
MIGRRFGLLGAAGYIAPRHLRAIRDVGGVLVAAADPHDSVGILDSYFPEAEFFTDSSAFHRHVAGKIDVLAVCTPNYLHTPHTAFGFGAGADVICEKPLALSVAEARALQTLEEGAGRKVWTVLQLRHLPEVRALRDEIQQFARRRKVKVEYVTRRGRWYGASWKGDDLLSGGVVANVGSHLFDLLAWVFAEPNPVKRLPATVTVTEANPARVRGTVTLARADVEFLLSVAPADLPPGHPGSAHRVLTVDGEPLDLTGGASGGVSFTDLHTEVYRATLAGAGWRISDALPGIALVEAVRKAAARLSDG